jgi:hypothetical protein
MARLRRVLGMVGMAAIFVSACGDDDDDDDGGFASGGASGSGGANAGTLGMATGGRTTSGGGGGQAGASGGGAGGASGGGAGGAPVACGGPTQTVDDINNKPCATPGATCDFGMECCCARCVPDYLCSCESGVWFCYSWDICREPCGGGGAGGGGNDSGGAGGRR